MESSNDLAALGQGSGRVLCSIRSIFPLDAVPDILTVDENKVTVELRQLLEAQTHVMLVSDIADVDLDATALYATLRLQPRATGAAWISISNLKKEEAAKARQLISGLMLAHERDIDLSQVDDGDLYGQVIACGVTPKA